MSVPGESSPINGNHIEGAPARRGDSRVVLICCLLAALTLAVFGKTVTYEFVNFDDDLYAYGTPLVEQGLTPAGVVEAFRQGSFANWDPLTTLSHMLDYQLFGRHAGGHHLTNVLLHTASVVLLFLIFHRMTGAIWSSAFVSAVFAIHPLHVESVAWVSERKDVLSGLFFILTLGAYTRYVRRPGAGSYLLVAGTFALGLMSKAMLLTLPFVLLLLDYWPLARLDCPDRKIAVRRLILEKIPLLAISVFVGAVTMFTQHGAHAVQTLGTISPLLRVENALVSCATYVWQMFWPTGLAVFYPYPENGLPAWRVILALLLVCGISAAAIVRSKRQPYLLVGWLWYLIMVAPVIGLVQVGTQARADRYTYLPQIGLCLALAWVAPAIFSRWSKRSVALAAAGGSAVAILSAVAFVQTAYWRNSETLWTRASECTTHNALARDELGYYYAARGRFDDAIFEFQQAIAILPGWGRAHDDLANLLLRQGHPDDAIVQYEEGLESDAANFTARDNLGNLLAEKGRLGEAIIQFQKAFEIEPDNYKAHINCGATYLQAGQVGLAAKEFQKALELKPDFDQARDDLNRLAWILASTPQNSVRDGGAALPMARQLVNLTASNSPVYLATLGAAEAETGHFAEAAAMAGRAIDLASGGGNGEMANALREQLSAYQSGKAIRDTNDPIFAAPVGRP